MYNQMPYSMYNPNIQYSPVNQVMQKSPGLLGGLSKKTFNWDGFLNNAQKTLNVINQAMPIYNQVKPMFKNMGTIFKIMNELNASSASVAPATVASATAANTPTFFA